MSNRMKQIQELQEKNRRKRGKKARWQASQAIAQAQSSQPQESGEETPSKEELLKKKKALAKGRVDDIIRQYCPEFQGQEKPQVWFLFCSGAQCVSGFFVTSFFCFLKGDTPWRMRLVPPTAETGTRRGPIPSPLRLRRWSQGWSGLDRHRPTGKVFRAGPSWVNAWAIPAGASPSFQGYPSGPGTTFCRTGASLFLSQI